MKPIIFYFLFFLFSLQPISAQEYRVSSPDEHLQVLIANEGSLHFLVQKDGKIIIPLVEVAMTSDKGIIPAEKDRVRKAEKQNVSTVIHPVVAIKNSSIADEYHELKLKFKNHFNVVFRVYNDAMAYRFETDYPDSVTVMHERFNISFPDSTNAWFAYNDRWMNGYEHVYKKQSIDSLGKDETVHLPLLLELKEGDKVLITESDLYDYPGLYFTGNNGRTLQSIFPPVVKTEKVNDTSRGSWDRTFRPASVYNYIAHTKGSRTYPWRIVALADRDDQLLKNEIVYKLAEPSRIKDSTWIKPGQVAWDWWNDWNITGVDFRAGVNTQTYKYYIDFASRNHIPYIIMDEGWYKLGNMTERVPEVDVKAIVDYGKQKNVGVMLWCVWRTLDNQMQEAMDLFEQWAIKGIKVYIVSPVNFVCNCF